MVVINEFASNGLIVDLSIMMSNLLIHRVFIVVDSIDGSKPDIIRGAQPFPAFQSIIEKKLDELKK